MTWLTVWTFLKRIPWQVWAALLLALALAYCLRLAYKAGQEEVQARWDAERAEVKALVEAKDKQYREAEKKAAERIAEIAARYEQEKVNAAEEARQSVLADVRAGRVGVRFRACPTAEAPATPEAPRGADGGTAVPEQDAFHLAIADSIALGAACDAQVTGLQDTIRAYQAMSEEVSR